MERTSQPGDASHADLAARGLADHVRIGSTASGQQVLRAAINDLQMLALAPASGLRRPWRVSSETPRTTSRGLPSSCDPGIDARTRQLEPASIHRRAI
jgi:hypothetical protein